MSSQERKDKPDDKVTNISEERKPKNEIEVGVKKKIYPLINYKINPLLSSSILNYLSIGISLAIFGCVKKKFFDLNNNIIFYPKYYLVSGIILYISGLFDWYEGKELLYLVDFILSFFFISLFFAEYPDKNGNNFFEYFNNFGTTGENDELRGTFYILLFLLFFCIAISYKNKGKIFILDHASLFIGFIFFFLYKFFDKDWMEKAYSYIFIISGGLFWLTGLLKMIDNFLTDKPLIFF